jgi:hypothetical protein
MLLHHIDVGSFDGADVGALTSPHACSNSFAVSFPDASSHSCSFFSALFASIASTLTDPDSSPELSTDSSSCREANTSTDPLSERSAELDAFSHSQPTSDASSDDGTIVISIAAAFASSELAPEPGSFGEPKPGAIEPSESIPDAGPIDSSFISSKSESYEYPKSKSDASTELAAFSISESTSFVASIFIAVTASKSDSKCSSIWSADIDSVSGAVDNPVFSSYFGSFI